MIMKRSIVLAFLIFSVHGSAQIWTVRYNGTGDSLDGAAAIAVDNQGNIYVTGESYGIGSATDYATLKYSYTVAVQERFVPSIAAGMSSVVRGPIRLEPGHKYKICDIAGREIVPEKMTGGVYFVMTDDRFSIKVIIID
jgi:hypothetical protein